MSHTVHTTFNPELELEVSDQEYLDLKRQGLLVKDDEDVPERPDRRASRWTDDTEKEN